jgi:mannose-6-phosphate isomerase-like protein (cupin superfamily)
MRLEKVNVAEKFSSITDHWQPRIAGRINDFAVKLVKLQGEFVWHHHDHEDELFFVVKGKLIMKLRDGDIEINAGEMLVVPHGVEHCPYAPEECEVLLFEPEATLNTGNVQNERTVAKPENI